MQSPCDVQGNGQLVTPQYLGLVQLHLSLLPPARHLITHRIFISSLIIMRLLYVGQPSLSQHSACICATPVNNRPFFTSCSVCTVHDPPLTQLLLLLRILIGL